MKRRRLIWFCHGIAELCKNPHLQKTLLIALFSTSKRLKKIKLSKWLIYGR